MDDEIIIEDAEEVEDTAPLPAVHQSSSHLPYAMPEFDSPADYLAWRGDQLMEALDRILVEGTHYGTIPGTKKLSLFKAGAEWLIKMFDLSFRSEVLPISVVDIPGRYVSVVIRGELYSADGRLLDTAIATCSSEESKWQRPYCPSCGEGVWDNRKNRRNPNDPDYACKDKAGCGWGGSSPAQGFSPDLVNTVFKMGEKRAKVAVALTGTGASSYFTQDVDDRTTSRKDRPSEKVTHPAPQSEPVTHFDRELGIRAMKRNADGSWPRVCPYCTSAVEQRSGTNKNGNPYSMWKCPNRDCVGGEPKNDGGFWSWGSFHDDPWRPGGEIDGMVDEVSLPRDDAGGFDPKAAMRQALAHLTSWKDEIKGTEVREVITDLGFVVPLTEAQVLEVAAAVTARYYDNHPDERPFS